MGELMERPVVRPEAINRPRHPPLPKRPKVVACPDCKRKFVTHFAMELHREAIPGHKDGGR